MHNHPPENPFVPQISIFLQSGAIFELRIHLFGLASDVDVVPYNDKLFISGNVQPLIPMHRADHHATCTVHSENSLVWTDQPYGRFGRDVPAQLKPGTECVILERSQDGGDYVIRYTIRNIKQRSFDPFQQTSHFSSSTMHHGNPVYSHNMNLHSDPFVFTRSPFRSYQEEYIVSSQESVFASNFTNARAVFEGTSQSVGVIPMQDVSAPAFCNHETVSTAHIPNYATTIPAAPPISSCFGLESSSIGPHAIPSSSLEAPRSTFTDPAIDTFLGEEHFNSAWISECPPIALDAGGPCLVNHTQSSVKPMPIISNTMPMNNSGLLDNLSHVHYSAEDHYSGSSHNIILGAIPSSPFSGPERTVSAVHGPPPVGLTSSLPFNPKTSVNCVLHTGQVPSSSNAVPPTALVPSESTLPPPLISRQFSSSPQPHISFEHSKNIPTHGDRFSMPPPLSTAGSSANFIPVVPSHQAQSISQDIHTAQSAAQANIGVSSAPIPSSLSHTGGCRVQRGLQRSIPASELVEQSSSHSAHEMITSESTIGRSVHSITEGKHDAAVRSLEVDHSSVVTRRGSVSTRDAWTGAAPTLPALPASQLGGPMPSVSTLSPRDIPPSFVPPPRGPCVPGAPVPGPTTTIPVGPSPSEFIVPTLDITKPVPPDAIPSLSPEPTPVGGSSALNTSTTFMGSSSESTESGITGFPWQGFGPGSSSSRSNIATREIVAQRKVAEMMNVAPEVSEGVDVVKDTSSRKESISVPNASDIKATESHFASSGSDSFSTGSLENHSKPLGISTSGLTSTEFTIAGETSSSSQESDIKQETGSTRHIMDQANSMPAVSSEASASLGRSDAAINVDAHKVVEIEGSRTPAVGGSTAGQMPSATGDSGSIVVQALAGAAVEAVQNVLHGETITEAVKHSAGSLIRNLATQVSSVQDVSVSGERGIMESVCSSSLQANPVPERMSTSEAILDHHEDLTTMSAAGTVQDMAKSTSQTRTVAECSTQQTIEQVDTTAQISLDTTETVAETSSSSQNITGSAVTIGTAVNNVSRPSVSEVTAAEAVTAAEFSTSSAGVVAAGSVTSESVIQTVSAAENAATVQSEDVVSGGIVVEREVSESKVIAGEAVTSVEGQVAGVGLVHTEGTVIDSEVSKSEVGRVTGGAAISVGEGEIQLAVPGTVRTEGVVVESEILKSEAEQVANEAIIMSVSEGHSVAQSSEVGLALASTETTEGEARRSTDVIASDAVPRGSSSRNMEVNATSVAEMHVSNTIVTSASATDVATSEFQAQSQGHSQIALVHSELMAEEDKASGENLSTPVDSNVVPVPVPPAPSTRQDVSFENKSNTSNMSVQSVRGGIQSQDVQQYLSEDVTHSAGHDTEPSERELAQTRSKNAEEVTRRHITQTSSTVTEGSTSRQQEKQKQSDIPSIVLFEPSSPVDLVVSVPSRHSSPKIPPTSQDVVEQSMTTLNEKTTSFLGSKEYALSGSKAKEIEAQTSITALPAIALGPSPVNLKDTLYTTASSSIPSQDDPPPAYSPARTSTLIGQSNITTLEKSVDVSIGAQTGIDQTSSSQSGSWSTSGLKVEASSAVQEDALHATSSNIVESTEITTSTAEASSRPDPYQRPSLVQQDSSFSDFVEVHHEESSEREVLSLSDSSNSSTVHVKAVKTRPKSSASHEVRSRTQGTRICLDDCCYWGKEVGPVGQQTVKQVMQSSDVSDSTDVDQRTQITRGKMLSDSIYSAKSVGSFVDITKEESTYLHVATEAITIGQVSLGTAVGTTTQNTFTSNTEPSDVSQVAEASETRVDIQFSHGKQSSESTESTSSHAEAGFLQGLHQSAAYKESSSELRTATTQNQEQQNILQSKQDLSDSLAELDYVNVHADQISSETLQNDGPQAKTQAAGLSSSIKVVDAMTSGSEVLNDTTSSSNETETVVAEKARNETTKSETTVIGLQESADDMIVSDAGVSSVSQIEQTLEVSAVDVTRREGDIVSGETASQDAACANSRARTGEIQTVSKELQVGSVVDNSTATLTSIELGTASQAVTDSESRNQLIDTTSLAFKSGDAQLVTVEVIENTSATVSEKEGTITESASRSITRPEDSESSSRAVIEETATKETLASTTSDTVSEPIAQFDSANVQTNTNTVTSSISRGNIDSNVTHAASTEVTMEASAAASTGTYAANASVSEVEQRESSTLMVKAAVQDTATATTAESSNESITRTLAQDNVASATVETSRTSERQEADISEVQLVVTSKSSDEASQNADSETKRVTRSEQVSSSESGQVERTAPPEIELSQQAQAFAQGIRSDEAIETAYTSIQETASISTKDEQNVTDANTNETHIEISNERISNAAEESLVKATAVSDATATYEEHHTQITAEAQETSVHSIAEDVKAAEHVETDASSATQAQVTISSTSETSVGDLGSQVLQGSATTQDVQNVVESTEASISAVEQTGQDAQVSESTAANVSAEASEVTAQMSTLTAQIVESETIRSSDTILSEKIVESSDALNVDTQTTERTVSSSNLDMGASTTATMEADDIARSADIQSAVQVAAGVKEVVVSEGSSEIVTHSEIVDTLTSEANSSVMTATTGTVGTLESRFAGDISERTTASDEDGKSAGTSEMHGSAEVSLAVTATSTIATTTNEVVSNTGSSSNQTTAVQTGASPDNRPANIDAQITESSVESEKTEGVASVIQESHESEQMRDSVVEITAQKSEGALGIVEGSTHEDNQQSSVSGESTLGASLGHQESLQEGGHMIPPSRRDSMITTSEGSIETTGTIKQSDISLIRTSMKANMGAGNIESAISDSEDKELSLSQSTLESGLVVPTHEEELEAHTNVIQTVADAEHTRRNFAPTTEEVPNIDIESDFHDDDESAMTVDVQTVAGYTEETSSRPVSFYSADDRTVNLLTPTDDGDSASTIFHSGSESTPASRAMTSTAEDFHSMSGDTFISSPSSSYITEQQLVTSPETSPPISTPATTVLSNEQRNTETRIETYTSSTSRQSVQEMSFARNDSPGSSGWGMFDPTALFKQTGNNTNYGRRKSGGTTEAFKMTKRA